MQKFDEMFTSSEPAMLQFQSFGEGGPSQLQMQGVRAHYEAYARWLARQPQEVMRARRVLGLLPG